MGTNPPPMPTPKKEKDAHVCYIQQKELLKRISVAQSYTEKTVKPVMLVFFFQSNLVFIITSFFNKCINLNYIELYQF